MTETKKAIWHYYIYKRIPDEFVVRKWLANSRDSAGIVGEANTLEEARKFVPDDRTLFYADPGDINNSGGYAIVEIWAV